MSRMDLDESQLAPFDGAFAKLVPNNLQAEALFSKTLIQVEAERDVYHLRFMVATNPEDSRVIQNEPVESDTDYDTPDSPLETTKKGGHFVLSLATGELPANPALGWRVGRGTHKIKPDRGVDFQLAPPRDPQSRALASIHMLFRFNRKSGMLMLVAGSSKAPVHYYNNGEWQSLEAPNVKVLHRPSTILRVGQLEYELVYTIDARHRKDYLDLRKTLFATYPSMVGGSNVLPSADFDRLPFDDHVQIHRYLLFETKGYGGFGWVSIGVDSETGDPVALKEVSIKRKSERDGLIEEVDYGRAFSVGQPMSWLTNVNRNRWSTI
jgi:hypothetical protein